MRWIDRNFTFNFINRQRKLIIDIVAYNYSWPQEFKEEKARLMKLVGDFMVGSIEHVGSTAVPGLMAKPVIDIMFGVESLAASRPAINKLKELSYCHAPYKENIMHWFCKPSEHVRSHHLHLVPFESPLWLERIAFRDALRRSPTTAREYQDLKLRLAKQYPNQRDTYTEKKWPFIQQVLTNLSL